MKLYNSRIFQVQATAFGSEGSFSDRHSVRLSPGEEKRMEVPFQRKGASFVMVGAFFPNEKTPFFRSIILLSAKPSDKTEEQDS